MSLSGRPTTNAVWPPSERPSALSTAAAGSRSSQVPGRWVSRVGVGVGVAEVDAAAVAVPAGAVLVRVTTTVFAGCPGPLPVEQAGTASSRPPAQHAQSRRRLITNRP
jgi:hypothetical protein